MTGYEYTPGPWRFRRDIIRKRGMDIGRCVIESIPATCFITTEVCASTHTLNETEANAQLIAAAPEMAEVLLALRNWYEESGYNGNGPSGAALLFDDDATLGTRLREALTKAGLL